MGSAIIRDEITKRVEQLKAHQNYKDPVPMPGESKIEFALRAAAHLISPPQIEGESNEIECVDMAEAILALGPELEKIWNKHN